MSATDLSRPKVGVLVTCLVDRFRPQVGFATAKLLEQAGCDVAVPAQTCCGQPAYNGGDPKDARILAQNVIAAFELYDYVVVPSGSCAGTIRTHYPLLFKNDDAWRARAESLAGKTHELFAFLVNVRGMTQVDAEAVGVAAYHDSCSSLRENGVLGEPRLLLQSVRGLRICEFRDPEVCCGFGGFFSVKYPEISARMADDKIADGKNVGARMIIGADLGCLLHLAGRLSRRGDRLKVRHAAELLAGMSTEPAIGESDDPGPML
jgi:L-lactate dehydrogenase complex protein LldE